MIDTLKLMLNEYQITDDSEIRVQPASYELGTGSGEAQEIFSNDKRSST